MAGPVCSSASGPRTPNFASILGRCGDTDNPVSRYRLEKWPETIAADRDQMRGEDDLQGGVIALRIDEAEPGQGQGRVPLMDDKRRLALCSSFANTQSLEADAVVRSCSTW